MVINASMPKNGLDGIRPGQVYERRVFSADQLAVVNELWKIRTGVIQDPGCHKDTEVIQFVERR